MPSLKPTKPLLRADLIVTQAEVEGVATFTVKDDVTGESFRMYAVEYAIAQRLDGQRDLEAVIAAVQEDLQLTVSMEELLRFVRELDARGLVRDFVDPSEADAPQGAPSQGPNLTQTATMHGTLLRTPPTALEDAPTVASPQDAVAAGAFALVTQELDLHERGSAALAKAGLTQEIAVDPQEVQKMLRDAIHRMVDDDVRGAASILHAAHALAPDDARVNALVEATQTAYDRGTQEAAAQLKERSASLFPELMPQPSAGATTRPDSGVAPPKVRPAFALLAAFGAVALVMGALWARGGLGRPVAVRAQTIAYAAHDERISPAASVHGAPLETLSFKNGGVVAQLPAVGARVQAQEVVASLRLPAALRQQLLMAGHALRQAEMAVLRLQRQREQVAGERRALIAQAGQSKPRGGDAKLKGHLRQLEREERRVRAALVAAQNRRAQAQQARAIKAEGARSLQIVAPRAGVVDAVSARVGEQVAPGAAVVSLVDGTRLTLSFPLHGPSKLQAPAQVPVLVGQGSGKTLMGTVQPGAGAPDGAPQLTVSLAGPDLPLAQEAYTLVASRHSKALHVPKEAVASSGPGPGAHLWQLVDGRIQKLPVAVLDGDAKGIWVAPLAPPVGEGVPVVVQVQGAAWPSLRDGARARTF